jgi:metallo-beta-lactamase family protein
MAMLDITACTPVHPLPDGEVRILGAVDVVTGSMTRVETAKKKLLVDCGIGQGREAQDWKFPDAARDVDAVLLTHGHLDHIGALPMLLDHGFERPILATKATLDIARISLQDSLHMSRASDREIEKFMHAFDKVARAIPYDAVGGHLPGFAGSLCFREAGHILGSASVEIVTDKSRVIVSGDLGRPNSPILRDAFTEWSDGRAVDVVVMESTYGARSHEHTHDDIERDLERVIKEAHARDGKILIPAFAIGRTQVLLYFLNELVEGKRIPKIPVALDTPMGTLVTETYEHARKLFDKETLAKIQRGDDPLDFDNLFVVRRGQDSAKLMDSRGPMIIIAGSGMCTGGRIVHHLVDGLPDPTCTVLLVGHQSVGTPGRRIQEAKAGGSTVWINHENVAVRCHIETLRGLSAHADRDELLAWLSHVPQPKRVALHHGEATSQRALIEYAQKKLS